MYECMIRRLMLAVSMCIFLFSTSDVYAQDQVPVLQTQDLVIIFGLFCISIIILVLYISRDVILRRKSRYDASKMDSQKNRDYEKYHSEWGDEWGWREDKQKKDGYKISKDDEYYNILGVKKNATMSEIKSKYRELAKKSHPDKNIDNSSAHMVMINRAYEVLSNKLLRKEYDEYLDGI